LGLGVQGPPRREGPLYLLDDAVSFHK